MGQIYVRASRRGKSNIKAYFRSSAIKTVKSLRLALTIEKGRNKRFGPDPITGFMKQSSIATALYHARNDVKKKKSVAANFKLNERARTRISKAKLDKILIKLGV